MPQISPGLLIALVAGMALLLLYAWSAYRSRAWKNINPNLVAGFMALVGCMVFWMSVLPSPIELDEPYTGVSGVGLGIAAAIFAPALAIGIHQWVRHRRALTRRHLVMFAAVFAFIGVVAWFQTPQARATNAHDYFNSAISALLLIAIAVPLLAVLALLLYVRLNTGNRMARLIQAERYDEAIRIGEVIPAPKRDSLVTTNLASAYRAAGRHADAIALAESIPADKRDNVMLITLARAYHAAGRSAEAHAAFQRIKPEDHWPEAVKQHVAEVGRKIGIAEGEASR